ncbi:EP300-interacting inhibitor of differentiation 2 isoform X1 [Falco peregrinus]|uniref:EP300-interacting inhibitor of differentiation 2 isoform X1 n=1 Tax=Falco peregrinus TaxID=8954 RepID=UPI002478EBFA|nr:EP300-interacting inhibitor of differentiation 2 isoform X1 [Falco peregrinus]
MGSGYSGSGRRLSCRPPPPSLPRPAGDRPPAARRDGPGPPAHPALCSSPHARCGAAPGGRALDEAAAGVAGLAPLGGPSPQTGPLGAEAGACRDAGGAAACSPEGSRRGEQAGRPDEEGVKSRAAGGGRRAVAFACRARPAAVGGSRWRCPRAPGGRRRRPSGLRSASCPARSAPNNAS